MVSPTLACIVGLEPALILQQVHYWTQTNGKERDGRRWMFMTLEDWTGQFPFMSAGSIRRYIKSLETLHVLVSSGRHGDRGAKGFRVSYEILSELVSHPRIIASTHRGTTFSTKSGGRSISPAKRDAILERDGHKCVYCGTPLTRKLAHKGRYNGTQTKTKPAGYQFLTVDHVFPCSRGGTNDMSNLAASCISCNARKHTKTPLEWATLKATQ